MVPQPGQLEVFACPRSVECVDEMAEAGMWASTKDEEGRRKMQGLISYKAQEWTWLKGENSADSVAKERERPVRAKRASS